MSKIEFYKKNWKMGIHLVFKTKRFGVNNRWWSDFDSMFTWSWRQRIIAIITIRPFIENLKLIHFRAVACHFMTDEEKKIVGWYKTTPWWTKINGRYLQ